MCTTPLSDTPLPQTPAPIHLPLLPLKCGPFSTKCHKTALKLLTVKGEMSQPGRKK